MTPREQASEICERHSINDDSPMAMEIAAAIEKATTYLTHQTAIGRE